jgi:hypothetical protein
VKEKMNSEISKQEALKILKKDGLKLKNLSPELKKDPEVVMTAIKNNGNAFQFTDSFFHDKMEFITTSVQNEHFNFLESNLNSLKFTIEALKNQKLNFDQIQDENLKRNKDVILIASRYDVSILKRIPEEFQNDFLFVKSIVQENGRTILCANENMKNNREILLEALKSDGYCIQFISKRHLMDPEMVLNAIIRNPKAFLLTAPKLKSNEKFIIEALFKNEKVFDFVKSTHPHLKDYMLRFRFSKRIENLKIQRLRNVNFIWMKYSRIEP